MDSESLYLDYNATSPLSQSVSDWLRSGDLLFANPASQHSAGKASRKIINESRATIYQTFSKNEKEANLFFHSGATEAMSTFAHSFAEVARLSGKDLLICYSPIDHPAVTSLGERYFGSHVKCLELKITQELEYDDEHNFQVIQDKKDNNPDLMILYHHLWVHNETGIVSALEKLKKFKSIPDLYLHVDAVQSPGKIPDWRELSVGDIFTFSAHKFGALKGIGFSFYPKSLPFSPMITGGSQQSGRSGTENALGVKTVALALADLVSVDVSTNLKIKNDLEAFMNSELKDLGVVIHGNNSNTIYFYLNALTSDIALALFDLSGLMISAGSACSSGAAKSSVLLLHLGLDGVSRNGLRLSLGFHTTPEELATIKMKFSSIMAKIKKN